MFSGANVYSVAADVLDAQGLPAGAGPLLLAVLIGLVGLLVLVGLWRMQSFWRRAVAATAEVVDIISYQTTRHGEGHSSASVQTHYAPVLRFQTPGGKTLYLTRMRGPYRLRPVPRNAPSMQKGDLAAAEVRWGGEAFAIGQVVPVFYDPRNHSHVELDPYKESGKRMPSVSWLALVIAGLTICLMLSAAAQYLAQLAR
jgi:hypothetical protein